LFSFYCNFKEYKKMKKMQLRQLIGMGKTLI